MRLGVFGGSFDPLHAGHLIVADDAAAALSLDRVLFVPSGQHPFKGGEVQASADLRRRMIEESIAGYDLFSLDDRELRRPGLSYTVDTLEELKEEHPAAELFLLIGSDILEEIDEWHRPEELVRLAQIAVLTRAEVDVDDASERSTPHVTVPVTHVAISSTEVRRRVRNGEPFRYLVPEAVHRIICEHSLYKRR